MPVVFRIMFTPPNKRLRPLENFCRLRREYPNFYEHYENFWKNYYVCISRLFAKLVHAIKQRIENIDEIM